MKDYSPKRRTALVLTGSGTSGAYHAGVLKALDESGVKIDLVVGSGIGSVAAAFSAVAGGPRLYGAGGFWEVSSWSSFYRLRPILRSVLGLLVAILGVFLVPATIALVIGLLFAAAAHRLARLVAGAGRGAGLSHGGGRRPSGRLRGGPRHSGVRPGPPRRGVPGAARLSRSEAHGGGVRVGPRRPAWLGAPLPRLVGRVAAALR